MKRADKKKGGRGRERRKFDLSLRQQIRLFVHNAVDPIVRRKEEEEEEEEPFPFFFVFVSPSPSSSSPPRPPPFPPSPFFIPLFLLLPPTPLSENNEPSGQIAWPEQNVINRSRFLFPSNLPLLHRYFPSNLRSIIE